MNQALAIGAALVLGAGVPWLGIRMLVPSLAAGRLVTNFRGREVFLGLGIAWLLWAGSAIIGGVVIGGMISATRHTAGDEAGSLVTILTLAGPLALVAFALGVVDDAYGSGEARGFRGHLQALAHGRLSTGGLKLVGISAASLVVALILAQIAPWGGAAASGDLQRVGTALLAGAAIALTSNFVNLMDLRPGRALKVYSALGVLGLVSIAVLLPFLAASGAFAVLSPVARTLDAIVLLIFVLGPVIATYRYDLGERGMLGDAGANPMGAVAGMLIVSGLPLWGLVLYLALVFGLNLLSERISFSHVIEGNRVLHRLDALGRLTDEDSSAML